MRSSNPFSCNPAAVLSPGVTSLQRPVACCERAVATGWRNTAQPQDHAGGGADPFTGSAAAATHHVPARGYLFYDAVPNTDAMRRKILELSSQLAADPATAGLALSGDEAAAGGLLESLMDRCEVLR